MKRRIVNTVIICLLVALTFGVLGVGVLGEGIAPIAENLEISTFVDTSVGGQLKALDPESGPLTFHITTPPRKGDIELGDNGSFVYTPNQGKRGRDYFGYKAENSKGEMSSEATVVIRIERQRAAVRYSDMDGHGAAAAAITLAERGIFVGERIGNQHVFNPERKVTRAEFLAMCLNLIDANILTGVMSTGFADDDDIPSFMKPYISTALLKGVINGYSDGHRKAVFNGGDYIRYSEAAVMLNRVLNLTDVNPSAYEGMVPVWAVQASANLSACRITTYAQREYSDFLNRADAAKLLLGAMRILENR